MFDEPIEQVDSCDDNEDVERFLAVFNGNSGNGLDFLLGITIGCLENDTFLGLGTSGLGKDEADGIVNEFFVPTEGVVVVVVEPNDDDDTDNDDADVGGGDGDGEVSLTTSSICFLYFAEMIWSQCSNKFFMKPWPIINLSLFFIETFS